jgi:hypothetical protein
MWASKLNFKKSLGSRAPLARYEQPTATAGCRGTTTDLARVAHVPRGYAALTVMSMRVACERLDAWDWVFGYMEEGRIADDRKQEMSRPTWWTPIGRLAFPGGRERPGKPGRYNGLRDYCWGLAGGAAGLAAGLAEAAGLGVGFAAGAAAAPTRVADFMVSSLG